MIFVAIKYVVRKGSFVPCKKTFQVEAKSHVEADNKAIDIASSHDGRPYGLDWLLAVNPLEEVRS